MEDFVVIHGSVGKWLVFQLLRKTIKEKLGPSASLDFGELEIGIEGEKAKLHVKDLEINMDVDDVKNLLGN